jgi:hypothetical protein
MIGVITFEIGIFNRSDELSVWKITLGLSNSVRYS